MSICLLWAFIVQPPWKAVRGYLKKLKMELPYDAATPLLGIYLNKPETLIQKNISTSVFIAALFTITKIWKRPKCPSVVKKRKVYPLQQHGWSSLGPSVVDKPVRERQIPYDFCCIEFHCVNVPQFFDPLVC